MALLYLETNTLVLLENIKQMNGVSHQYDNTSFRKKKKNDCVVLKDITVELVKKAKQINRMSHQYR